MLDRRSTVLLFLAVLAVGVLWPVVAGAVSCGDCCEGRRNACGAVPAAGFSLCCFHAVSVLPDLPPADIAPAAGSRLAPADEDGGPPPDPRGVLHVPRPILT